MSTAQPIEDGNLPAARQRLGNAISALIDDKPHTIQHDTQGTRVEWVQSLYTQLADAVHTGPGQDGAYLGVPASKPPLWTEAADILRDIDKTIRKWQPDPGIFDGDLTNENPPTPETIRRLRTIDTQRWRPQDANQLEQWAHRLEKWANQIRDELIDPESRKTLNDPCPACDVKTVYRMVDGENVRQPALRITTERCWCLNCGADWIFPGHLAHLCRLLGYELPPGVLE